MSSLGGRPRRKNPLLRTRVPAQPPAPRSRVALRLTAAAARGAFELQVCRQCAAVQYPPREACGRCLSTDLVWRRQSGGGVLLAPALLHHSHEQYFRDRLPWRIGLIRLDCGAVVIAHLHAALARADERVRVLARLDRSGHAALCAVPENQEERMSEDRQLAEMLCTPKGRKALVTDAKSATGQALVRALLSAGSEIVWAGVAEPWRRAPGLEALAGDARVTTVPLDLTNADSVREASALLGAKVDILVNNAELHRAYGISARAGLEAARSEMDVNYFGLLRLAQEFGPVMRARSADTPAGAVAWVNILSIYALSNFPAQGTFSASKAAAYSLSQCLRAEMLRAGIRVVHAFPGPIDEEWNQQLPAPKVTPEALARSIVQALEQGIEDVFVGEVAQEWLARWLEDPKVLERELAGGAA